jgi:hypothetical protein
LLNVLLKLEKKNWDSKTKKTKKQNLKIFFIFFEKLGVATLVSMTSYGIDDREFGVRVSVDGRIFFLPVVLSDSVAHQTCLMGNGIKEAAARS